MDAIQWSAYIYIIYIFVCIYIVVHIFVAATAQSNSLRLCSCSSEDNGKSSTERQRWEKYEAKIPTAIANAHRESSVLLIFIIIISTRFFCSTQLPRQGQSFHVSSQCFCLFPSRISFAHFLATS